MNGKYGFIPLGDLVKPHIDCKNPTITDVKLLHNIVKNAKNHNFMGAQFFFFFWSHWATYRIQHNTITIAIMNTLP